ncbi:acyltransferase [Pseudomonas sp. MAP12]|uniref:Acyltransferase n=1 Tax=Geopseudomonas aromaticivorans TaxID=2849492 RepID=A0ABS6MXQ2_9GAMM|nr:acyltransferase [Pseudomonas aromaticivorans]
MPKVSAAAASGDGFRADINGLRAWAVVAVVLYHFNVAGFAGGFAGVDIFFVISGFLMASIVVGGLDTGRFNLPGFYLARARRILPALLVLVFAVLVVGWLLLMPSDYQTLGRHARESVLFSSNLQYLSESGYFDAASHEKWLLHTWSLSVEWQFYLIYPLLLMLLARVLPQSRPLLAVHLLALSASFAWCLLLTFEQPVRAFYLLPSRAWELLLGGSVFLLGRQMRLPERWPALVEGLGIALVAASIALIDASLPWPGALALLPTVGTALVLLAGRASSPWTGSAAAQWLGTRSYSIYLWHWPLVAGLVYFDRHNEVAWIVVGLALSLVMGHVSYVLVEVPARRWLASRTNVRSAVWLVTCLVVVAVSAQLVRRSGFPARLPEVLARVEAERHNKNPRQDECLSADARCIFGGQQVRALVVGDSHADALVTAVAAALPGSGEGVYFKAESGCLFVFGAKWAGKGERDDCRRLLEEVVAGLDSLYPGTPLILINRTTAYALGELPAPGGKPPHPMVYFSQKADGNDPAFQAEFRQHYLDTVCQLARHRPLYLLRPVPEMPADVPKAVGRAMQRGLPHEVSITRDQYRQRHAFVWGLQDEAARQCGAHILDPLPYLCDEQYCYGSRDGLPLYVDDDHLSETGNRRLVPMFARVFTDQSAPAGSPAMAQKR